MIHNFLSFCCEHPFSHLTKSTQVQGAKARKKRIIFVLFFLTRQQRRFYQETLIKLLQWFHSFLTALLHVFDIQLENEIIIMMIIAFCKDFFTMKQLSIRQMSKTKFSHIFLQVSLNSKHHSLVAMACLVVSWIFFRLESFNRSSHELSDIFDPGTTIIKIHLFDLKKICHNSIIDIFITQLPSIHDTKKN